MREREKYTQKNAKKNPKNPKTANWKNGHDLPNQVTNP